MSEAPDDCCHRAWKLSMAEQRIDGCLRGRRTMRTRLVQSELHASQAASLDMSSAWRTRCAHQGQFGEARRRFPLNDIAHWRTCQRSFAESTEIFTITTTSIWQMTWYLKILFLGICLLPPTSVSPLPRLRQKTSLESQRIAITLSSSGRSHVELLTRARKPGSIGTYWSSARVRIAKERRSMLS